MNNTNKKEFKCPHKHTHTEVREVFDGDEEWQEHQEVCSDCGNILSVQETTHGVAA